MNLNSALHYISKVEANSRVNILLELNDNYTLLIEGSFVVSRATEVLVSSIEYIDSDFNPELLEKIQSSLENKNVVEASFSEKTGMLTLELENGVKLESFSGEDDYEAWELCINGITIYGSECGNIVHY